MSQSEIIVRLGIFALLTALVVVRQRFIAKYDHPETRLAYTILLVALALCLISPNHQFIAQDIGITAERFKDITLLNPYYFIGLVTIVISIQVIGVFLLHMLGEKASLAFTGFVGGLASSTAVAQVYALYSRKADVKSVSNNYAAATVLANGSSLLHKIVIVTISNIQFLPFVLPFLISHLIVGVGMGYKLLPEKGASDGKLHASYFSLFPVVWFVIILLSVGILTQIVPILISENGEVVSAGITLLGGLDTTLIEISKLYGTQIGLTVAVGAIIASFSINIIGKIIYSAVLGTKQYFLTVTKGLLLTLALSIVIELAVLGLMQLIL
jgi:uncharacterized membrane protein (DUF4010 family)